MMHRGLVIIDMKLFSVLLSWEDLVIPIKGVNQSLQGSISWEGCLGTLKLS